MGVSGNLNRNMKKENLSQLITKHSLFTPLIKELIKSLLISEKIKFHVVEHRTKELNSLDNKLTRKKISDLENVTDISGLRVILYYQDDIDKVDLLLKRNFIIDEENSVDKSEILNSNEFGYLSIHYIVQLNESRNKLPEWNAFSKLKAEIQIRTVLQHSWASISHELSYKKRYEIPKELERKLFRLAGLFELADEQFLIIRDEHKKLDSTIEELTKLNKIKQLDINSLTLKYALEKSGSIYQKIINRAYEIGFNKYDESTDTEYIDSDSTQYCYSEIILITKILTLKSLDELESGLKKNEQLIDKVFTAAVKRHDDWGAGTTFLTLIASLTLLNAKELKIFSQKSGWHNENFDCIVNAITENKKL